MTTMNDNPVLFSMNKPTQERIACVDIWQNVAWDLQRDNFISMETERLLDEGMEFDDIDLDIHDESKYYDMFVAEYTRKLSDELHINLKFKRHYHDTFGWGITDIYVQYEDHDIKTLEKYIQDNELNDELQSHLEHVTQYSSGYIPRFTDIESLKQDDAYMIALLNVCLANEDNRLPMNIAESHMNDFFYMHNLLLINGELEN